MRRLSTIRIHIPLLFLTWAGGFFLPGLIRAQETSVLPLRNDFFGDKEWERRFTYYYGVESSIEPTINSEEKDLFEQLVPLIRTDVQAAIASLKGSILPESSAALNFTLGNLYFEAGDFNSAIKSYRTAIDKFPKFMRAYNLLGKVHVRIGKLKEAIPYFVKTIGLGGAEGDLFGLLGYCYLNGRLIDSALSAYNLALLYEPESSDWKLGKAQCLIQLQRWEDSIGLLDEMLKEKPDKIELWILQANAYLGERKTMDAAANYEIVRRMGKATPESLFQLGDIYINDGLNRLAYPVYVEALKNAKTGSIRRSIRVAGILAGRGSWDNAAKYITSIRKSYGERLSEENILSLLSLDSEIALATGNTDKAVKTLKQIIERDPLNCKSLLLLAGFQWKDGKVEEAIFNYETARKIDDCQNQALLDQAQMHVSLSEYSKAVPLLRESLDLEPNDNVEKYLEAVERAALSASIK